MPDLARGKVPAPAALAGLMTGLLPSSKQAAIVGDLGTRTWAGLCTLLAVLESFMVTSSPAA